MRYRRRAILATVLATSAVLLGGGVAPYATAGCVGPEIATGGEVDNPPSAASGGIEFTRGQLVTISGAPFRRGCSDVGVGGGCAADPGRGPDPGSPLTNVQLTMQQGQRSWVLGTGDAGALSAGFSIRWDVQIPYEVETGPAELRADTASLPIRIRA